MKIFNRYRYFNHLFFNQYTCISSPIHTGGSRSLKIEGPILNLLESMGKFER